MSQISNHIARAPHALLTLSLTILVAACGGSSHSVAPGTGDAEPDWSAELVAASEGMAANPTEPYWSFRSAEIQLALGDSVGAETSLVQALELDRDHTPSLLLISKIQYRSGRHEQAISLLERAVAREAPEADALRIALALNYEALGAQQAARETLALCESDPSLRPTAEVFLALRGDDYLQSRPIAKAALEADPARAANHNNYGIALLYDGEPEAARVAFLEALALDDQLAGALYNLAIVETYYFYDLNKGREWFQRYAQLDDDDPDDLGSVFGIDLAANTTPSSSDFLAGSSNDGR